MNTSTVEVRVGSEPAGQVKFFEVGAVAETPLGPLSFRPDGLDPQTRSFWRRFLGHNATVIDLAHKSTANTFTVTPFRKELVINGSAFRWSSSFLGREAYWKSGGEVVATIVGERRRQPGTVTVSEAVQVNQATMLVFAGVYLFVSGRAG